MGPYKIKKIRFISNPESQPALQNKEITEFLLLFRTALKKNPVYHYQSRTGTRPTKKG